MKRLVFFISLIILIGIINLYAFRDPFQSWLPKKVKKPEETFEKEEEPVSSEELRLEVEGMVWDTPHPQAIINGKIYNIGDKIQGGEIIDIDKRGVSILYKGRNFVFEVRR